VTDILGEFLNPPAPPPPPPEALLDEPPPPPPPAITRYSTVFEPQALPPFDTQKFPGPVKL